MSVKTRISKITSVEIESKYFLQPFFLVTY